jgi:alpha-glucoside transport system permease protein
LTTERVATGAATAGRAAAPTTTAPAGRPKRDWRAPLTTAVFLVPALVVLGFLVLYPIFATIVRSLYDAPGSNFIGLANYETMFTSERTLTALRNNLIWVVFAPTLATVIGLVFAVLVERIRWGTAFKLAVFMPMAVSLLATGVIWRQVYELEPDVGLANAAVQGVSKVVSSPGAYPGARPSQGSQLTAEGQALVTSPTVRPGATADLGLVAIPPRLIPESARPAAGAGGRQAPPDAISGVVWFDFTRGGGGQPGQVDPTEVGLPGMKVEALRGSEVAASAETGDDGSFTLTGLGAGDYRLRLADSNFRPAFGGFNWLGPTLVTPAMIVAYLWIWAGFALVVIAAGLAAVPRETLEAARTDGANEWQVFRRVMVPQLMPVLLVVLVTLMVNVLKIFDLVFIIAPGDVQDSANVLALEMYRSSFGGGSDQGLGSAVAVLLFVLVLPAIIINWRRFKADQA